MLKAKLSKGPIRIAGTMSGTSMDGVDVAVLETDGEQIFEFGETAYRPYSEAEQRVISRAMGQWSGPDVDRAAVTVQVAHQQVLKGLENLELIGFHGQTLSHDPRGGRTLQVGDGAGLAQDLKTPVAWDFRGADVQMGGEGAPLAPFFHFACAKWMKADAPVAFLNLGGVGNLTWVDPRKSGPEQEGALLAFDTGPANAPIDDLMRERFGKGYDENGSLAMKGVVETGALELFLAETFFSRMPPKSLDRNDFAEMITLVRELSDADAAATLTGMAAAAVAQGMEHCPSLPETLLVTGGGRKNPVLMEMLRVSLDCDVEPVEAVGLDGDMLEAQAFAFLAARVARGLPTSGPSTTGVKALVGGGVLSYPAA
ncbi:MAG: anhydro-N-acetylmuramic acid kinase [Cognatishimia sp.]|uniref:anhydro-N-acetylmuramic acid kinase n=1 Tax=Cognatishimia sp. TaxID=2211648 RepID=UPI003B8B7B26